MTKTDPPRWRIEDWEAGRPRWSVGGEASVPRWSRTRRGGIHISEVADLAITSGESDDDLKFGVVFPAALYLGEEEREVTAEKMLARPILVSPSEVLEEEDESSGLSSPFPDPRLRLFLVF
ncbi:unnamed protein product [Linum trigynum]|uniref:Uncharacterized protein n=1 Tax=Linum trigynum TaxID=586398 RepID=A0AAV2DXT2_9ROSI